MSGLPPTDENVNIPPAVQALSATADALFKAQFINQDTVQVEGEDDTSGGNEQPAAQEQEVEKETKPGKPLKADIERLYHGEKGRREQLQAQLREAEERMAAMEAQLNARKIAAPVQPPAPTRKQLVTEEEVKEFTPEFIDLVRRVAQEEVIPVASRFENTFTQFDKKVNAVAGVVVQSAQEKMYQYLDQTVPEWREINRNDDFLDWLEGSIPLSGQKRLDMLQSFYGRNDGPQVAKFFQTFLAEHAAVAPRANSTQTPRQPSVSLEQLAAPGRAKSVAPQAPTDDQTPFFTRSQVTQFYADVRRGAFAGRDAERDQLEKQIIAAGAAGRITD